MTPLELARKRKELVERVEALTASSLPSEWDGSDNCLCPGCSQPHDPAAVVAWTKRRNELPKQPWHNHSLVAAKAAHPAGKGKPATPHGGNSRPKAPLALVAAQNTKPDALNDLKQALKELNAAEYPADVMPPELRNVITAARELAGVPEPEVLTAASLWGDSK